MARFSVPSTPARQVKSVSEFVSVNFTDTSGIISDSQSPDAQNMIRDVPGKVRKCMGYERVKEYNAPINGFHSRRKDSEGLLHAGTNLYKGDTVIYSDMANDRSTSFQMEDKLYIIDGKALLVYDGETVKRATDVATIPTITIAKGSEKVTSYDSINLLQPKYRESFYSTANTFTVSLAPLDDNSPIVVEWLNESGEWQDISNKIQSKDYQSGTIILTEAPTISITGEDNVRITVQRTVDGYADRINKCKIGILFGVNGATDRIFLSGNPDPDFINYDWYSAQNDPTYFPDTGYSVLGTQQSAVTGYSIVNNYLATHKDDRETDRNIIVRRGDLVDSNPAFPIINTMQGSGCIAPNSIAYLGTEPLFLTKQGVFAVTTSDLSGDKYSQRRSYFLDGKLGLEPNREDAYACIYNDMYWLCLNGVAYILDGLQPIATDRSAPYSTRQYAGFYRTNLPARVMWVQNERLYFGSKDGTVYRFYNDSLSPASYNDVGEPIDAYWTVPYNFGGRFWLNKNFRKLAVMIDPAPITSVKMQALRNGAWETVQTASVGSRYFSWPYVQWSKWSWKHDYTPQTILAKAKIKKVDKVQYRFQNDNLNEPFGLLQYACEYTTGSYFKG